MGLLLKQEISRESTAGKRPETAIPGNASGNISSSKGKTVIPVLSTHSEDRSKMPEAIV